MRGGTSRAVFFAENDIAKYSSEDKNKIILTALGSPDPYGRQIDGLGGGISSLSKVGIIGKSSTSGIDLTFTFGQVDVRTPIIDWGGTCGNMMAAVGPYGIEENLIQARGPLTKVCILATNTSQIIEAHVSVKDGQYEGEGDYAIAGVPGTGSAIQLDFINPSGNTTGSILPTSNPTDTIQISPNKTISVSIVDVTIPVVFVRAEDVSADITKFPPDLDADTALQSLLETIRVHASQKMQLSNGAANSLISSKAVPKVVMIGSSTSYQTSDNRYIATHETDLCIRAISMGLTHRTIPATVSMCLAAAANINNTIVHDTIGDAMQGPLRIGHPAGVIEVGAEMEQVGGLWQAKRITTYRTARRIMEGSILVPFSSLG